jgi:hypothetical protein
MSDVKKLAAVASVVGALLVAPGASAVPPAAQALNPPAPDGYTCNATGGGTICTGSFPEDIVSEPQFELVCGSGPDAFIIHDNGHLERDATRWYDQDGNLTRRVFHDQWLSAYWSNPLSGKTVQYIQNDKITDDLLVPGDFASARETQTGVNNYFDPVTHRKVLQSTGRTVFGADGTLESSSGHQWSIDMFVNGDTSVLDGVCAALA